MPARSVRVVKDNLQFCCGEHYRKHFNIPTYSERSDHVTFNRDRAQLRALGKLGTG